MHSVRNTLRAKPAHHIANAQAVMTPTLSRSCMKNSKSSFPNRHCKKEQKGMDCAISHANHVTRQKAFKI